MSQNNPGATPSLFSLVSATGLVVVTFALIGFVALSVVTGNTFGLNSSDSLGFPTPTQAILAVEPDGTPNPAAMIPFKSAALGFSLDYPRTWRKVETGLQLILAPSGAGLEAGNRQAASLRLGIPADSTIEAADLLLRLEAELAGSPGLAQVSQRTVTIGGQSWPAVNLEFEDPQRGGTTMATIAAASKNEVGYYMIAVAPAEQWAALQPSLRSILGSFRFTTEGVLRPTDATPPPTPTPTPTPVFHIIQSGDTLLKIAGQYGVEVDALAARNNINDPRSLRVGTKLIIPLKRRR